MREPGISLTCLTAGPLHRVAAILALYRPVVDEIICAVHGGFRPEELRSLEAVCDRIIACEMGADFLQERYRPWLYAQCSRAFIATVDSDEVPSAALLNELPGLARADDVVTYLTTCRWCWPDPSHFLDEYPWEPSWKMILVRNDPATLYLRAGVHEGAMAVAPYQCVELPIYHLDCAIRPVAQRAAKVAFYDTLEGRQRLEDGRPVSDVYYLPERWSRYPPRALDPVDVALIEAVLKAEDPADRVLEQTAAPGEGLLPGTVPLTEILEHLPERPLPDDGYRARVSLRRGRSPARSLSQLQPDEARSAMVLVENLSPVTWLREGRNRVYLSFRFFSAASRHDLVLEGGRFPLPANLHPGRAALIPFELRAPSARGRYRLAIDLVEEGVRWFDAPAELDVVVA